MTALYCRESTRNALTYSDAHALLDAVAAGADVPLEKINEALVLTGDLEIKEEKIMQENPKTPRELENVMQYETWIERAAAVVEVLEVAGSAEVARALSVSTGNASSMLSRALEKGWIAPKTQTSPRKYVATAKWAEHALSVRASAGGDLALCEVAPMPSGPLAGTHWYGMDKRVTSWSRA